jgi:hypothetical protein
MAAEGFNAPVIDDEWVEHEITVKGQLPPGVEPQDGMTITGPNGESITGYEWISKESGTY